MRPVAMWIAVVLTVSGVGMLKVEVIFPCESVLMSNTLLSLSPYVVCPVII